MINRRDFLKKSLFGTMALSLMGGMACSQKIPQKPNIVFIMCDDLNDIAVNYQGHSQARLPNIDELSEILNKLSAISFLIPIPLSITFISIESMES